MTEDQKTAALAKLEALAVVAERNGLAATARSWRRYAESVASRPAAEIVLAASSPMATGAEPFGERFR